MSKFCFHTKTALLVVTWYIMVVTWDLYSWLNFIRNQKVVAFLDPQHTDCTPVLNCFLISKSSAQKFPFIINETDLWERSRLERHAQILALYTLLAASWHAKTQRGDRSLVLLPPHERQSITSEDASAPHILAFHWQLLLVLSQITKDGNFRELCYLSSYGNNDGEKEL